ncbi:molybdopterin-dependent oxidoreductase [Oricola sp.]|uniref:molybdopterin-dependent oxidoreductase n=1 Tax=Oricola sp. TaxID=1979950 RepID=UPI003BAB8833
MTASRNKAARYTAAHWGTYEIEDGCEEGSVPDVPRLMPVGLDPQPSQAGRGWMSSASDVATRIRRPAIRRGWLDGDGGAGRNDDAFVEVGWDVALDLAAGELQRVIADHGNAAIYGGSYGWASAGRFHHAQSQLRRFLNLTGGYTAARDTYSHAAAEVLLPHVVGMSMRDFEDSLTSWPLIEANCSLFLAFGGVSDRTAQIASGGTAEHEVGHWMKRAAANGMRTVCISPLKSDIADLPGASWLPVRANSDVALMLALCHELLVNGWHDEDFLRRCTSGWEDFRDYVLGARDDVPKSPAWAAPFCDLPEADIRALAAELPNNKVMVSVAWGLQRADHGEQAIWAGLALACLLGQIGQPGTGFAFGYGSTTTPGRPKRLIGWPAMPQGRNPVEEFIPVARLSDMLLNPGGTYAYNGALRRYPEIRLVYWAGGNPFHHHQDLLRLETAWTAPETVIVHDHSWTATARRADIVLPCTTSLERTDMMISRRDPRLVHMSPAMPVIGEARSDHTIFGGLAERMDIADDFTDGRSEEEWLRWLWAGAQAVAQQEGFALPDYETFRDRGLVTVPDADETRTPFEEFVADPDAAPLATENGKITLFNRRIDAMDLADCPGHPAWLEPREWTYRAPPDRLHLISNQPNLRLHSQLDNGDTARAAKRRGREVCQMHAQTAERLGFAKGDIVCIRNDRGACLASLELKDDMRADCLVLPTGAWLDLQDTHAGRIDVHGNPNVLTIDKGASGLSQGNISHTTLVRVEKWDGPLPDIAVHSQPEFVERARPLSGSPYELAS